MNDVLNKMPINIPAIEICSSLSCFWTDPGLIYFLWGPVCPARMWSHLLCLSRLPSVPLAPENRSPLGAIAEPGCAWLSVSHTLTPFVFWFPLSLRNVLSQGHFLSCSCPFSRPWHNKQTEWKVFSFLLLWSFWEPYFLLGSCLQWWVTAII